MDKKTLAKSTGHLARSLYGSIAPVRVVDTKNLWRKTGGTKRTLTLAHGATRAFTRHAGEEVGYPVLSIYASRTLSPEALAAAEKFLAETTLTMADLVDADGHDIDDVLPEDIILRIINNRELVGEYTTVKAQQDTTWDAFATSFKAEEQARQAARLKSQAILDTKITRHDLEKKFMHELSQLGISDLVSIASENSVMIDVSTLKALIVLAQEAKISVPACMTCGSTHEAMFGKDANGKRVAYCFDCRPAETCDFCFSASEPCDCDWHKTDKIPDLDLL